MKNILFLILFISQLVFSQNEGTIQGTVRNQENKDPLSGATILVEGTTFGTSSDKDGKFFITNVLIGKYTISASYIGYVIQKKTIYVSGDEVVDVDFALSPTILPGQEVIITATRAKERETPVAFTNMVKKDIETKYWAQDIPMLLNELPNVYSYSDNGNGIGYSYMKIRGFDQRRIGVMINGIPLNDAESHEVFWVDLPDFAASTEDIQVQRGVGNSLYGASAFGGSVNLITAGTSFLPRVELNTGYGSFNTKKFSLSANSGLLNNTYNIYGRFSRIETDGYRKPSWSKLWSYFFGLSRYDENMVTKINIFGGPEQSYLSYRGVTRDQLEGKITGDKKEDRRINPIQYPNEIDNFYQPHYQLINDWQINPDLRFENTVFTFLGKGEYTQLRTRRDIREYNIPRFKVSDSTFLPADYYKTNALGMPLRGTDGLFEVRRLDIIRKRSVNDIDYGWQPRITWKHADGEFVAGGEYRFHKGHHYGEVVWANLLPSNIKPDWRYYDYVVPKTSITAYIHELYRLTPELSLMGDLQIRYHNIKLIDEKRYKVEFSRNYTFVTPRAGANYNLTENLSAFVNVSMAKREPAFKDIYNPQDYWISPVNLPKNFIKDGDVFSYVGKELKPEQLMNYEIGSAYRTEDLNFKLNLYWMDFRNEIIPTGQIDDNGVPISGNADRTVHRGVELAAGIKLLENFRFDGNFSINDDRFIKHTEYVVTNWNTTPPTTAPLVYDNKVLGGFPKYISNLRVSYMYGGLLATVHLQSLGKMYLDNTQNNEKSLAPYSVVNGMIAYRLEKFLGNSDIELSLVGNNLLNRFYEAGGYVEEGIPYWIPAATRNAFFSIKILI
ncbi:MAG: TonB-dependent receptor [Bacteroidetes bacterium]|nr:TonB-dependent receptor [Bacteroidota bacterium]MBU1421638.1 TonB-dependent receptor [Bacteroidota bacterium]